MCRSKMINTLLPTRTLIITLIALLNIRCVPCDNPDCLHGESWYENCKICRCSNGKPECTDSPTCVNSNIKELCSVNGIFWIEDDMRCHCEWENNIQTTICVKTAYQPAMDGAPCSHEQFSYFYDTNTYCECNRNRVTSCQQRQRSNIDGFCLLDENIIEGCFKCICTKTKFKICKYNLQCNNVVGKPGKCPANERKNESSNTLILKVLCFYSKIQKCYNDYHCAGNEKCCLNVCDSFCVEPEQIN